MREHDSAGDGVAGGKPLLIVVGSSYATYRSYIFEAVAQRYRLWLLNPGPASWEVPYIEGSSVVDCLDAEKIAVAAREVTERHEVAGIFCYDEAFIEPAAHASAALGFTTWDPEAIARCRDKHTTRALMREAGLLQPVTAAVATFADARAFAEQVGYPVILKPRNLGGSLGVRKVDRPEDLAAAFAVTDTVRLPGVREFDDYVLVEEFVEGKEIAVDCVFYDGVCHPLVVAHKVLGTEAPYEFEEVGHDVVEHDPLLRDPELLDVLRRSHDAVGFRNGVTHTEFKLTPRGFVLIEINARMGGGLIPHLGYLTSGNNESLAAADTVAGREPTVVSAEQHRAASIRFAYPPYDLEVTSARARTDLITGAVRQLEIGVTPGMSVRIPPRGIARSGFVIAVADTIAETRAAVADPARFFEITGTPLPEPAS